MPITSLREVVSWEKGGGGISRLSLCRAEGESGGENEKKGIDRRQLLSRAASKIPPGSGRKVPLPSLPICRIAAVVVAEEECLLRLEAEGGETNGSRRDTRQRVSTRRSLMSRVEKALKVARKS